MPRADFVCCSIQSFFRNSQRIEHLIDLLDGRPFRWRADELKATQLVGRLTRVAPQLPSTIEAQLKWDAKALADKLPEIEKQFQGDVSVLQLLSTVYLNRGETESTERCVQQWIAKTPSYDAWQKLAEIKKFRNDMDGWIEAFDRSLEYPVLGLEHAVTRSAVAEYYLGKEDAQRALPYAEKGA